MARKRNPNGRPPLPPECPLEYARALYEGEGYATCMPYHKRKQATFAIGIDMDNPEPLEKVLPCFGRPRITTFWDSERKKVRFRVMKRGKAGLEIGRQLATSKLAKAKIEQTLNRCRKYWQKGYTDQIK